MDGKNTGTRPLNPYPLNKSRPDKKASVPTGRLPPPPPTPHKLHHIRIPRVPITHTPPPTTRLVVPRTPPKDLPTQFTSHTPTSPESPRRRANKFPRPLHPKHTHCPTVAQLQIPQFFTPNINTTPIHPNTSPQPLEEETKDLTSPCENSHLYTHIISPGQTPPYTPRE